MIRNQKGSLNQKLEGHEVHEAWWVHSAIKAIVGHHFWSTYSIANAVTQYSKVQYCTTFNKGINKATAGSFCHFRAACALQTLQGCSRRAEKMTARGKVVASL